MITLYGHPISFNSRKVHWALEELGVPYKYQTVDLSKGEQKREPLLSKNPNGRVPVLEDGAVSMFESNAILWYLADRYGAGKILPLDADRRALVHQWVSWQASDLGPSIMGPWLMLFYARVAGAPYDEAKLLAACAAAERPLSILEARIAAPYVVGDAFSIADIALAESFGQCEGARIEVTNYPNLRAWFSRLAERPAFVKTRAPREPSRS
jgi:glutathione S-transferase